jgi:hypothetical protein
MKSELKKWYYNICKSIISNIYEYKNIYEKIDKVKNKSRTKKINVLIYSFDAEYDDSTESNSKTLIYKKYWDMLLITNSEFVYYKVKNEANPLYGGFFYIKSAIVDGRRRINFSYHIDPSHHIYNDPKCIIM